MLTVSNLIKHVKDVEVFNLGCGFRFKIGQNSLGYMCRSGSNYIFVFGDIKRKFENEEEVLTKLSSTLEEAIKSRECLSKLLSEIIDILEELDFSYSVASYSSVQCTLIDGETFAVSVMATDKYSVAYDWHEYILNKAELFDYLTRHEKLFVKCINNRKE